MPRPGLPGEFELIARYFAPLAAGAPGAFGLTDDAAVLAVPSGREIVATVDALVAGVHFLPADPAAGVARRLLRVNLSDLAAMGATPRAYLLALALPRWIDALWVEEFARGLGADQAEFDISLLGGDTVATDGPLTLSLTALGEVPAGRALRRTGAGAGDDIYVSGTIGDGALGLLVRRGRLTGLAQHHLAALAARYDLALPRTVLGPRLVGLASAAIDISDGLLADLAHLAENSGLAAEVAADRVPLSDGARAALAANSGLWDLILGGGDDYELLFAAPPARAGKIAALAAALGLPLTPIGRLKAGRGVTARDIEGHPLSVPKPGYTHF